MKDFVTWVVIILICGSLLYSCSREFSEQGITKYWGGTMEISLEPNAKLCEVTWKDDSLWFLTKQMNEEDVAETYQFYEKDSLGILEGTVIIKETKLTEEELAKYEEDKAQQFTLMADYYINGNFAEDGSCRFIQYDYETNWYTKLQDYTYDENGYLIGVSP